MTKRELLEAIFRELGPAVGAAGFSVDKKNQAFVRPIDGGVQKILLAIVDREPELTLSLVLGCRLETVEETFHRFSGSPPAAQGDTLTTMTQLSYFFADQGKKQFKVVSPADLSGCVRELRSLIAERVVPFFDAHRTVDALNDAFHSGNEPRFDVSAHPARAMHALIVAHLARDARFDALAAGYEDQMGKFPASQLAKFSALVSYLRAAARS